MINTIFKLYRLIKPQTFKKFSTLSDKDFFLNIAKHKIEISKEIDEKDYSNFINEDNVKENNNFQEINDDIDYYNIDRFNIENDVKTLSLSNNTNSAINNQQNDAKQLENIENENMVKKIFNKIADIPLDELCNTQSDIRNVAPLINRNETMINLLKMGVDLFRFENKKGGDNILVRLQWEKDVVPIITFLKDQAEFNDKQIAQIISHNPRIFRTSIVELEEVFINLKGRSLILTDVAHIVSTQPNILNMSSQDISKKLTDLESMISLTTNEMNTIIVALPRIVSAPLTKMKSVIVQLHKIIGFTKDETKQVVLRCPQLFIRDREVIAKNYIFLHRFLNIQFEEIVKYSAALAVTPSVLEERVKYLIFLNRYQTDPTKELYTPISAIIEGVDGEFCLKVAHTSLAQFRKNEYRLKFYKSRLLILKS